MKKYDRKKNIFLIGPMGAGKSTIGLYLSRILNMDFYDSDKVIEKNTGVDISWVFDIEGESKFRLREEKIINELTQKQGIILATGGGSILSYISRKKLSSRGLVIYLSTSIEKQFIRTKNDKKRPLLNSKKSVKDVLKYLSLERNPLYESIADVTFSTDYKNVKSIINDILNYIQYK
ncbi:shikimate kinase AroK [Buchnera aphidicola (Kurisakia onigurumii)]|uniref:shikimate kinase AroK n=1 Tax=Buchnera aphidicola TaxID=9 RepID=UPI0031B69B3F